MRDFAYQSYTESDKINFFYNKIEHKYQMALDTSYKGDFMSNTLEEATELIENLAASNANHCLYYDIRTRFSVSNKAIEDVTAKVDIILKVLRRILNLVEYQDHQEFVDN